MHLTLISLQPKKHVAAPEFDSNPFVWHPIMQVVTFVPQIERHSMSWGIIASSSPIPLFAKFRTKNSITNAILLVCDDDDESDLLFCMAITKNVLRGG